MTKKNQENKIFPILFFLLFSNTITKRTQSTNQENSSNSWEYMVHWYKSPFSLIYTRVSHSLYITYTRWDLWTMHIFIYTIHICYKIKVKINVLTISLLLFAYVSVYTYSSFCFVTISVLKKHKINFKLRGRIFINEIESDRCGIFTFEFFVYILSIKWGFFFICSRRVECRRALGYGFNSIIIQLFRLFLKSIVWEFLFI